MQNNLKTRQICLFIITFLPITKIFTLPSILAGKANEDMWISALLCFLLDLITVIFVSFALKNADCDFYTLLERCFGKTGKKIILFFYLILFLLKAIMPINEQKDYISLTLYETTSNTFTFFPVFLVGYYFCVKSKRVIGRCSDMLWFSTIIGMATLFSLSITSADFSALLPLFAPKTNKVFTACFNGLSWFGDGVYLTFFLGNFIYKKQDAVKIIGSFLISGLMVILFMVVFYGIFTSIAHRQQFALTEISKYTAIINNIGRFDYIGILSLLFVGVFSMIIPLYFATEILNIIFPFKSKWISALIVNVFMLAFNIIFRENFASIQTLMTNYSGFYFLIFANVLPCFTPLLVAKSKKEALYAIS